MTLTIEKGNEVLRFNPVPNGDIEITQQRKNRPLDWSLTDEKPIASIPKSQRAAVAHYLVTGEVMP